MRGIIISLVLFFPSTAAYADGALAVTAANDRIEFRLVANFADQAAAEANARVVCGHRVCATILDFRNTCVVVATGVELRDARIAAGSSVENAQKLAMSACAAAKRGLTCRVAEYICDYGSGPGQAIVRKNWADAFVFGNPSIPITRIDQTSQQSTSATGRPEHVLGLPQEVAIMLFALITLLTIAYFVRLHQLSNRPTAAREVMKSPVVRQPARPSGHNVFENQTIEREFAEPARNASHLMSTALNRKETPRRSNEVDTPIPALDVEPNFAAKEPRLAEEPELEPSSFPQAPIEEAVTIPPSSNEPPPIPTQALLQAILKKQAELSSLIERLNSESRNSSDQRGPPFGGRANNYSKRDADPRLENASRDRHDRTPTMASRSLETRPDQQPPTMHSQQYGSAGMSKGFGIAALLLSLVAIGIPLIGVLVSMIAIVGAVVAALAGDRMWGTATTIIVAVNTFFLSPLLLMSIFGDHSSGIFYLLVIMCALPFAAMILNKTGKIALGAIR